MAKRAVFHPPSPHAEATRAVLDTAGPAWSLMGGLAPVASLGGSRSGVWNWQTPKYLFRRPPIPPFLTRSSGYHQPEVHLRRGWARFVCLHALRLITSNRCSVAKKGKLWGHAIVDWANPLQTHSMFTTLAIYAIQTSPQKPILFALTRRTRSCYSWNLSTTFGKLDNLLAISSRFEGHANSKRPIATRPSWPLEQDHPLGYTQGQR